MYSDYHICNSISYHKSVHNIRCYNSHLILVLVFGVSNEMKVNHFELVAKLHFHWGFRRDKITICEWKFGNISVPSFIGGGLW